MCSVALSLLVKFDLMGAAEIAELLGISRQRTDVLTKQKGFPDPVAELSAGRIWLKDDVVRWAVETGRIEP